jgi:NAD(P)H-dependent FMN reductase
MPTLQIVIASTRPGRIGLPVAEWLEKEARAHGAFDIDVADLAVIDLPFLDEPNHPRLQRYEKEHTKAWSARVAAADAFAFVTPEYNYGMAATLKNALDFLHVEWANKPCGFVSYGGVSAGTRGVQHAKQIVTTLSIVPVPIAVSIPFVTQFLDDDGVIQPNEMMEGSVRAMLDGLVAMEAALRPLREG